MTWGRVKSQKGRRQQMKKVLAVCFMVFALGLYSPGAWSLVSDYNATFLDNGGVPGDNTTAQCDFINGFDLLQGNLTASDATDSITVQVIVATIVGNGNPSPPFPAGNAGCTDIDPMTDCGDSLPTCNNIDAPDKGTLANDETYEITICQPPVGAVGCDGAPLFTLEFQPANTGGGNVVQTAGNPAINVTPTNIDMTNPVNWTNNFVVTISNLKAAGFNYAAPWGIKFFANSRVDGPGEDVFGGTVTPPPPELDCSKSFNVSTVAPNDIITATVVISNTGGSGTAVQINDTLDAGLVYVPGSTKINGIAAADPAIIGDTLQWNGVNAPLGNTTVTYEIQVANIAPLQELCNSVVVISQDFGGIATSCFACVRRLGPPAINCAKSFNTSQVSPGSIITATVQVNNTGSSATAVQIVDTLDVGLSYIAGTTKINGIAAADPAVAGQVLTWASVNAPIGTTTITYEISVDAISSGETLCNSVVMSSIDFPTIPSASCSACVSMPRELVPGMTHYGAAAAGLLMLFATLGIVRRRRNHG